MLLFYQKRTIEKLKDKLDRETEKFNKERLDRETEVSFCSTSFLFKIARILTKRLSHWNVFLYPE